MNTFNLRLSVFMALTTALITPMAMAEVPAVLPAIDPGQVQRTLSQDAAERFRLKKTTPTAAPAVQTPTSVIKQGAGLTFRLNQVNIVGATVYKTAELLPLYQAYLHKNVSLHDLQKIVDSITAKYRSDGYILSKAILPPQKIGQGEVTIRVIEGYIEQTLIEGPAGNARPLLEGFADQIIQQRPMQVKTLERYAFLADELPGVDIKTVLRPSPNTPGASDLALVVTKMQPYNLFASVDNRGTRYMGPNELFVGGMLNSYFRAGDRTSVTVAQTSQIRELQFIQANYLTPIKAEGLTAEVNVQNAYNQPGYTLQRLGIVGRSQEISLRVNYPVLRTRKHNVLFMAAFNARNTYTDILDTCLYRDKVRTLQMQLSYSGSDVWSGINSITSNVYQGTKLLGASSADARNLSRPGAEPTFTRVNVTASRLQALPRNFSVLASVTGQYAFDPLLSSEQFGYGGANFGRGYDSFEIAGDRGAAAKAELRYDMPFDKRFLKNIQYYTFYDVGAVWNIKTAAQLAKQTGASAGIGARFALNKELQSSLEIAKPLTRPVASLTPNGLRPRIFFNVTWMQ